MNSRKVLSVGFFCVTAMATTLLFNNCGDGFEKSGKTMLSSTGTPTPGPGPSPTGTVNVTTTSPNNTSELNRSFKVPIVIDRTGEYATKTLTLKVNSPEIDAMDPMNGFNTLVSPATLAPGVALSEVTVSIATSAPSFTNQHFHVELWDGNLIIDEVEVNLTVQPVVRFQVRGNGIGDANWTSNGTASTQLFAGATRDIPFIAHTGGLQVIFENFASTNLIVHSSGAIPHGGTAAGQELAPSPDGGVTRGGTYMPNRIMPVQRSNAPVYHHISENNNAARRLLFNANL